jgi:tetratricopeptide (TPR) repeat protein
MKRVLVLFTSILLFSPFTGMAAETGYVVGHVSYKMTIPEGDPGEMGGRPGMVDRQSNELEIEIACVKEDYSQTLFKTRTDKDGYFYLADQPLDGLYRVASIQRPDSPSIPIIIPPPGPGTDAAGKVFMLFSSRHEANAPIIDLGATIVELLMTDSSGETPTQIVVEREYGDKKKILDSRKEKSFDQIKGHYGYPALEHYAGSGPKDLQRVAKRALEDRQKFDRAEYLKEEADQLSENDRDAAITKYREAVQTYPAYLDAYDGLIGLLADMEREEEAVSALEEGIRNCPSPEGLYVHCRMAAQYYMTAGDAKKAIPLYEKYLSLRPDNSWAIVHLAKAYIADSRFEDAHNVVNKENKSVIYYAVHYDFEKVNRIPDAKEMLQKTISTYGDRSLSISLEDIEKKWESLP